MMNFEQPGEQPDLSARGLTCVVRKYAHAILTNPH